MTNTRSADTAHETRKADPVQDARSILDDPNTADMLRRCTEIQALRARLNAVGSPDLHPEDPATVHEQDVLRRYSALHHTIAEAQKHAAESMRHELSDAYATTGSDRLRAVEDASQRIRQGLAAMTAARDLLVHYGRSREGRLADLSNRVWKDPRFTDAMGAVGETRRKVDALSQRMHVGKVVEGRKAIYEAHLAKVNRVKDRIEQEALATDAAQALVREYREMQARREAARNAAMAALEAEMEVLLTDLVAEHFPEAKIADGAGREG